eukprot:gene446-807_t
MRPLTDEEMRVMFSKLESYIGQNIAKLIDRNDEPYTFRLIKDRVFYLSEQQMRLATNIARDNLISIGVCFGKFTKVALNKFEFVSRPSICSRVQGLKEGELRSTSVRAKNQKLISISKSKSKWVDFSEDCQVCGILDDNERQKSNIVALVWVKLIAVLVIEVFVQVCALTAVRVLVLYMELLVPFLRINLCHSRGFGFVLAELNEFSLLSRFGWSISRFSNLLASDQLTLVASSMFSGGPIGTIGGDFRFTLLNAMVVLDGICTNGAQNSIILSIAG